jgi:hypothetical protein
MKKIFLSLVLILGSTTALAQPPQFILGHNGSIMQANFDPRTGAFTIVYAQPKPSLLAIGVVPGTLLISVPDGYQDVYKGFPYRLLSGGQVEALTGDGPRVYGNWAEFVKATGH